MTVIDQRNNTYETNDHPGLFGIWVRPTTAFHLNANSEFMSADNFVTRISPFHPQQYRVDASYVSRPRLTLAANISILQQSNRIADINFHGHNRNYSFDALVSRDERLGLDLAYNFTDYKQNANVRVKAGFKASDILIEFDSKKIDKLYDFTEALRAHKPGDKVSVDSPARNRKNNPDVTLEIHK